MTSCHLSIGSWLVTIIERRPKRSSTNFQEIVACAGVEGIKPPVIKHQEIDPARARA